MTAERTVPFDAAKVPRKPDEQTLRLHLSAAMDALSEYHWPGNVRELENAVEASTILAQNIIVILVFCLGCAVGLAGFSRVLNYLLGKFHNLTLAFLAGLITGSLMKIWPWKEVLETQVIRGKTHVIWGRPIMPDTFAGEFYFALALMALGFLVILAIERLAKGEV